jgi:SAM-dependent methyltransferase
MTDRVPIEACPLCDARAREHWLDALGFELVRCARCGHRYATSVHSEAVLANVYYDEPDAAIAARSIAAKAERIEEYWKLIDPALPEQARVLDVGCNAGELLSLFQQRGCRVFGIEASPGPARNAEKRLGVPIWHGRAEDVLPESERFDLIVLSHVLEHIHSPGPLLARLRRALAPGGRLLIEVPNADDALLRAWGGVYRPLCPGDHVSFFDAEHLGGVLRDSGFMLRQLGSPTHARDVVYPCLLSAVDGVRAALGRTRGAAPASSGVCGQTRYRGRLRRPLLAAIDRVLTVLDPAFVRGARRWTSLAQGAVLIALAAPA